MLHTEQRLFRGCCIYHPTLKWYHWGLDVITYLLCSARCSLSTALCLLLSAACWLMSCSYSCACLSCTLSRRSWSLSTLSLARHASSRCLCHDSISDSKAVTWPCSTAFWAISDALWEESVEFSTWNTGNNQNFNVWIKQWRQSHNNSLDTVIYWQFYKDNTKWLSCTSSTCSFAVCVCKTAFCSCRVVVCRCCPIIWLLRDVFWFSSCLSCTLSRLLSVCSEAFLGK